MQYATYCPEDNKLRLYIGRVPREEFEQLRAEGWTCTPKQDCNFVAVWTTEREDTALKYSPDGIEDEDQSPADRAADRAERFGGYADKRADEATGHADRFDSAPLLHGHQSQALAERRAAQHDRIATRAVNQWDKAEYWQSRTAGVISHALHVSTPAVRMGRIKEIEADIRRCDADHESFRKLYTAWEKVAGFEGMDVLLPMGENGYADTDAMTEAQGYAYAVAASGSQNVHMMHPDPDVNENGRRVHTNYFHGFSAYDMLTHDRYGGGVFRRLTPKACADLFLAKYVHPDKMERRNYNHSKLRLAYELQMLEAQGGRAAFVEMEAGGWLGKYQVVKVNKSNATGRVCSVAVIDPKWQVCDKWGNEYPAGHVPKPRQLVINIERLQSSVYRAPTDEERAAFTDSKKAAKKEAAQAKKAAPPAPTLCNPTNEDAERLQLVWNAQARAEGDYDADKPHPVIYSTQAVYSANLKAGSGETYDITGGGKRSRSSWSRGDFATVAKVRGSRRQVVVLTDKPQKAFPAIVWEDPRPAARAEVVAKIVQLAEAVTQVFAGVGHYKENLCDENRVLFTRALLVGLAFSSSQTQWGLTEEGWKIAKDAGYGVETVTGHAEQAELAI